MATPITPMRLTPEDLANADAIIRSGAASSVSAAARLGLEYLAEGIRRGDVGILAPKPTDVKLTTRRPRARARGRSAARSTR